MVGRGLLTQFEGIDFEQTTIPFVDNIEKAEQTITRINYAASNDGVRPLLFCSIIDYEVRRKISESEGLLLDFFETFISPLEKELNTRSATVVGRSHAMGAEASYKSRIDAVNFALTNDDGITIHNFPSADIILVGVSRSGKTPTCLYLALQYGIMAANYPLTEEDLGSSHLPSILEPFREKLFGLTIEPTRLQQIRHERRTDSRYSSLEQCQFEVRSVENLYRREQVSFVDTSSASIEEIATSIMAETGLQRRLRG